MNNPCNARAFHIITVGDDAGVIHTGHAEGTFTVIGSAYTRTNKGQAALAAATRASNFFRKLSDLCVEESFELEITFMGSNRDDHLKWLQHQREQEIE